MISRLHIRLSVFLIAGVNAQTNLPDVSPGVFNISTRIVIGTNTAAVWETLLDFPKYPDWNPFVRSVLVISPDNITLPDQRPAEGRRLLQRTQIPPLPLPVDATTPDNLLHTQIAYENVTHVQPDRLRLAWAYAETPATLLAAERWQAISDLGHGEVLYESREVYHGSLASTLLATLGASLQEGFDAQGRGLKLLLEH